MSKRFRIGCQGIFRTTTLIAGLVMPAVWVASARPAAAQQAYLGTMSGKVSDPSGAKVPGAKVIVTQGGTNYVNTIKTNSAGDFAIPSLNPGTYTVTVSADGFSTETQTNLVLSAGETKEADFVLKLGKTSDVVTVIAGNDLLDTSSANNVTVLSEQEVTDLPNNGRNPYVMATLAPGIQNGGSGGYFQGTSSRFTNPFSGTAVQIVADGLSGNNRLTLDGQPNDGAERLSGASYTGFVPSPEAVQEVQISSSIFDVQTGHGNGTVTNLVIKNGTNTLHGSLYYVFQNTYLNANNRQNNAAGFNRGNDQLNQTGFVLSGPVVIPKLYDGHDKTFFTFAFELYQSHAVTAYESLVPTAAQLKGDFSSYCTQWDGRGFCLNGDQLYVPTSPLKGGTGPDATTRTQFFPYNNIAPALNATGVALANLYPAPNIAGAAPGVNNYLAKEDSYESKYPSYTVRFDQQITRNNRLNANYFQAGLEQATPTEGFDKGAAPEYCGVCGYNVYRRTKGGQLDDQQIFGPTLVLSSHFGLNYHPFGLHYPGEKYDLSKLGIAGNFPVSSFPGADPSSQGYAALEPGAAGQVTTDTTGTLTEVLTKTHGAHTIKVGEDWSIKRYNVHQPQDGFTGFGYSGIFTQLDPINNYQDPTQPNEFSNDSLADMLLGYPSSGGYSINASFAFQQIYFAPFAQDTWRATKRLTLTYGARWDYEAPLTERFNKIVNGFCFTCVNPLQSQVSGIQLLGGLTYATPQNRTAYPKYYKGIQPRLGFAFQLTPSTVLGGGYGQIYFNSLDTPPGTGYTQSTSYQGYLPQSNLPQTSISNPFPNGILLPTGNSAGLATDLGQTPAFFDPKHVPERSTEYTLNVQQQFPGRVVLKVAYVGKNPNHLWVNRYLNILPANLWNQGPAGITYINTPLPNPLAGLLPQNGTLNAPTVYRYYLSVPFPQFSNVYQGESGIGSATYNALQLQVIHPMWHHVSFQGNFTWDKSMNHTSYLDNYHQALGQLASVVGASPNLYGNIFGTVELPKLQKAAAWERLSVGGWKFNSVIRLENGPLIGAPGGFQVVGNYRPQHGGGIYDQYNTCYQVYTIDYTHNSVSYANRLTSYNSAGVVTRKACDSATQAPAFRQLIPYQSVTSSPVLNVRQFGIHPLADMSLFKQFLFAEGKSFEIRGEFFNIFNTGEFGGPGGLGASNAGSSAGAPSAASPLGTFTQLNDPRIGQLTARFNF